MASRSTRATLTLEALDRLGSADGSTQQVVEEVARRVVGVVGADTYFLSATDPDSGQCLGPGITYNFVDEARQSFGEHELEVPDYNKFGDLTAKDPVGDLRQATGGKLSRSARYRSLHAIAGLDDELRVAFYVGGRPWGHLQLNRHTGDSPFTDSDQKFLHTAAPLAGAAVRRAQLAGPPRIDPGRGPGVVVLDDTGTVISTTAEANAWLEELAVEYRDEATYIGMHPELLMISLSALAKPGAPSRRARLRTPGGVWLIAHVSPLAGSEHVVVVIEPAKASEIAPIAIDAYGLTPREVEVTRLVARGLSTDEIASTLFLSRHTVRDHLKSTFDKVGVSSRGQLTSRLFAEHYRPSPTDAMYTLADHTQTTA